MAFPPRPAFLNQLRGFLRSKKISTAANAANLGMKRSALGPQLLSLICTSALITGSHAATLVAHYDFEDGGNLGNDVSGNGNHATTVAATAVAGHIGTGAAGFSEATANQFTRTGGLNNYTGVPGRSFVAWVNVDPASTSFDGIITMDGGACCVDRILMNAAGTPYYNLGEHVDKNIGAPGVTDGSWIHVALVGDNVGGGAESRFYINGVAHTANPQTHSTLTDASALNLYLGVGEMGTSHPMTGLLDDVRIYEGALTAQEVNNLFTGIPEPSAALLCLFGSSALLFRRRRGN